MAHGPAYSSPKVVRPRLHGVVARPRLFARIAACNAPVKWIAAGPGAGKTALAASYLDTLAACRLWYQLDAADGDAATFLFYLRRAAVQAGVRRAGALPLPPAEGISSVDGFARRYFAALFAVLPRPSIIVFDNVEDAAGPALHGILRAAFEQVPADIDIIVLSLSDPPPELARLAANGAITAIHAEELRFTREESDAVVQSRLNLDDAAMAALHERSAGWAAGLVLMIDHARRAHDVPQVAESQEAVFSYFAGEILARMNPVDQRMLMLTAALPRITTRLAEAMSGHGDAARVLEQFHARHLFVDRRHGPELVYHYHGLFRAFLQTRARTSLAAAERIESAQRAAILMEMDGMVEDAITMYLAAQDWRAASRLIVQRAHALYEQGRWRTLLDWIAAVPSGVHDVEPWLRYWVGACQVWIDPPLARRMLEQAYVQFESVAERNGQILAAGALTRAFMLHADWGELDRWIVALEALLGGDTSTIPGPTLLAGFSRLLYAAMARLPQHARLAEWAERALDTLGSEAEPSQAMLAAFSLLTYFTWTGQTAKQEQVVRLAEPLIDHPRLSPVSLAYWLWAYSNHLLQCASPPEALAAIDRALELALSNGLTIATVIRRHRIGHLLTVGRLDEAQLELGKLATVPRVEPYFELRAWLALRQGDLSLARREAHAALLMASERGRTFYQALDLALLGMICAESGDNEQALAHLRAYRDLTSGMSGEFARFQAALIEASVGLRREDRLACHLRLRDALEIGSRQRYRAYWGWSPSMIVPLLTEALEHGICTAYVCDLIKVHKLRPGRSDVANWPWPVAIHTLGRFELRVDGVSLRFEGKAQRKPLELLKIVIAEGERSIAVDRLISLLWDNPDAGGRKAFDITVHRLRKLLGSEEALEITDRHLQLNTRMVWVDALALDNMLQGLVPTSDNPPAIGLLEAAAVRVLNLYRGGFLAGDAEAPWQIAARNRFAGRFQRFVQRLGEHWESTAQWSRAAELYQQVIELDPLAESFYRRQMVCLLAQERRAEALELFRRCRQVLSITLALAPSPETEAVYRQLLAT